MVSRATVGVPITFHQVLQDNAGEMLGKETLRYPKHPIWRTAYSQSLGVLPPRYQANAQQIALEWPWQPQDGPGMPG